jgi:hypothetical protein
MSIKNLTFKVFCTKQASAVFKLSTDTGLVRHTT